MFVIPAGNKMIRCIVWVAEGESVDPGKSGESNKFPFLDRHVEESLMLSEHILIVLRGECSESCFF